MSFFTTEFLRDYGIAPAEFQILHALFLRGATLTRDYLPKFARWADSEGFTLEELEQATRQCLQKGWIKVLTEEDCQQDRLRWEGDPLQNCGNRPYEPNYVDYTPEGARLSRTLHTAWYQSMGKDIQDEVIYSCPIPGQFRVYATYRESLEQTLDEIRAGKASPILCPTRVLAIGQITPMEGWWVTRYVQMPQAYYCDVWYELIDEE